MNATTKAPVHLWIVGILAVLWNAVGCFDYFATQSQMESYMSQFTPEQLEYFYGFPAWVDACWAIAVWGSLLGSLLLLVRKAWAVWLFGLAILGMAGEYDVTFDFKETVAIRPGYELAKPYHSAASELVLVIKDTDIMLIIE